MLYGSNKFSRDFCCMDCFLNEVLENVVSEDDYKSVQIICNCELAEDVLKTLSNAEINGFGLTYAMIEFNNEEYDKEYVISVTSEGELWCEPLWRSTNEYHEAGYIYTEGDIVFIYKDDINDEILDNIGAEVLVDFTINE